MATLGVDLDCQAIDVFYEQSTMDCDLTVRSSGGAVAQTLDGVRYAAGTVLNVIGVNSAVYGEQTDPALKRFEELALFSVLDENLLSTIPFIVPNEDVSFECAVVSEPAGVNMRLGPGTDFAKTTAIRHQHPVVFLGDIQTPNGEIWHLTATSKTPEQPIQYAYARSDLFTITPCSL
jgi:hypothetical protein